MEIERNESAQSYTTKHHEFKSSLLGLTDQLVLEGVPVLQPERSVFLQHCETIKNGWYPEFPP